MIHVGHLGVYAAQGVEVTTGGSGVGTVDGRLVTLNGLRCLAHVAVGTAEEVVGAHALVGRAVAVVVLAGKQEQRVAGHGDVVAVHGVGLGDDGGHAPARLCRVAGGQHHAERKHQQEGGKAPLHDRTYIRYHVHPCKSTK